MRAATVPLCEACWLCEEGSMGASPVRLREPAIETCHRCKQTTRSGIYVRRMIEQKD
jgi:hypothetical protein